MPTIDIDAATATRTSTPSLLENVVVSDTSKTGVDIVAGMIMIMGDTTGDLTKLNNGRIEICLYKGSVSPANLQQSYTHTSADFPNAATLNFLLFPVAAAGDGDNGSSQTASGATINWNVDPGTWVMTAEFSGQVATGALLSNSIYAAGTSGGFPLIAFRQYQRSGRHTIEQSLTVNA